MTEHDNFTQGKSGGETLKHKGPANPPSNPLKSGGINRPLRPTRQR